MSVQSSRVMMTKVVRKEWYISSKWKTGRCGLPTCVHTGTTINQCNALDETGTTVQCYVSSKWKIWGCSLPTCVHTGTTAAKNNVLVKVE